MKKVHDPTKDGMTVGDHLLHPNYMRLFPRGEITVLSVADSKHYTASTSCFGIDEDLRIRLWNDYRKLAQKQTELYQKGKCSKEELQARYYIYIMSRDIQTVDCDCPLESPSYVDRQQVFAKDLDPICIGRTCAVTSSRMSFIMGRPREARRNGRVLLTNMLERGMLTGPSLVRNRPRTSGPTRTSASSTFALSV